MRIAWVGPAPTDLSGGVPYASTQLLEGLANEGVELDCFLPVSARAIPRRLAEHENLNFVTAPSRWRRGRWYSRTPLASFVSGQTARAIGQGRLIHQIARRHRERPYDLYYQFSQIELLAARRLRRSLPPIVLHPEVHAAGELRWHRREARLARRCEARAWHLAVRAMLAARAHAQKRDARLACLVVAVSRIFGRDLKRDYAIPERSIRVVPNPVDLARFAPNGASPDPTQPLELLYVSRIAVRKGVEMIVRLSHALADLRGRVRLTVIGDHSVWSDYRPLLRDLNPDVARYVGFVGAEQVPQVVRSAAVLLQPSHYDPFALTVGEALASGVPVVASDQVGSAEDLSPSCCERFPAGEQAPFEAAVRRTLERLWSGEHASIRSVARAEAERLFDPRRVSLVLAGHLKEAAEAS